MGTPGEEPMKAATEKAKAESIRQAAAVNPNGAGPEPVQREVVKKAMYDALMQATNDQLQSVTAGVEVIKSNARASSAWRSRGTFRFLAAADKRLTRAGNQMGISGKKIERLHAFILKGTNLLIIKPAPGHDLSAHPIHRMPDRPGASVTLYDLLAEYNLLGDIGWRERFDVAFIPKGSPQWPGVAIDLGDAQERRRIKGKEEEEGETK